MNRRQFLHASAIASSLAAFEGRAFAANGDRPLRVALVGCGWYGKTDLCHLMQVAPVEVVGLCDVDRRQLDGAVALVAQRQPSGKRPPTFGDYQDLLAAESPEIVLIDTPDHWHALPMIAACQAGADVYVQKPISIDVVEGQAMVAVARKHDRVVQVGLQRRSTPHLLDARDRFIQSGRLGKVAAVDIHSHYSVRGDFPAAADPPAELDWNSYVGPAPWTAYRPEIHPRSWRALQAFGNGQIGDLCVHFFDFVRYLLDLGWPRRVSAFGGAFQRPASSTVDVPDTQTALFEYPDLNIAWTQRSWGVPTDSDFPWGATLYGEHGTLKIGVRSFEFLGSGQSQPERGEFLDEREQFPEDVAHSETEFFAAPATRRHMQDFLTARQEQRRPVADIEQGHISSAACILANLSMRLGRSLTWDAENELVVGDDEANDRLARPYRSPWVHPTPADV